MNLPSTLNDARPIAFPWRRCAIVATLLLAGGVVAAMLDVPVERRTFNVTVGGFETTDAGRMLRTGGYLPFWLMIALAIASQRRYIVGSWRPVANRSVLALPLATIAAGVLAELVKIVARRRRPNALFHWYDFRPFFDRPLDAGGLSMPSSHAIISFAAAFTLARLFPGGRWVFILFAVGTAFSRVHAGAHFVTDVYASMILGWVCAWAVWTYRWPARSTASTTQMPSELRGAQSTAYAP